RSGASLKWNNTYAQPSAILLNHYRSAVYMHGGRCNGVTSVDGNRLDTGYPCYQHIGATGPSGMVSSPVIEWNNKYIDGEGHVAGYVQFVHNGNFVPNPH